MPTRSRFTWKSRSPPPPEAALNNFRSSEPYHPRATADLARHLAERLAGLDFTIGSDWVDPEAQRPLFNGKC